MHTIKILDTSYAAEAHALNNYSFPEFAGSDTVEGFASWLESTPCFGEFEDGVLQSKIHVIPMTFRLEDVEYKSTGIGAVGTYPEARGKGGIRRLFERILAWEKEEGVVLSFLGPFSYEFYKKFGYERIFETLTLTWSMEAFPDGKRQAGTIKRLSFEDALPYMTTLYHEDELSKGFGAIRNKEQWNDKGWKDKDIHIAVYFDTAGEATGYVVYSFTVDTFTIKEIIHGDQEALLALAQYIKVHGANAHKVVYISHNPRTSEIPLYQLTEALFDCQMSLRPRMQMRIVDVEKFLQAYPYQKVLDVTIDQIPLFKQCSIQVLDRTAPWNQAIFDLRGKRLDQAREKHVILSVEALTLWFSGYKKSPELIIVGEIETNEREACKVIDQFLASRVPAMTEDF